MSDKYHKYYIKNSEKLKAKRKEYYRNNLEKIKNSLNNKEYYKDHLKQMLFAGAKQRSKIYNIDFNIEKNDIIIPQACPYLEIPIFIDQEKIHSPSIDRIDNNKGYVKGNVIVVSRRANVLKNNLSLNEIIKINDNYNFVPVDNESVEFDITYNLRRIKTRAKKANIAYNITIKDLVLTKNCPLLNIPLFKAQGKTIDNTPEIDRINYLLGYVPNNVRIISRKANRSKSNSTMKEYNTLTKNLVEIYEKFEKKKQVLYY